MSDYIRKAVELADGFSLSGLGGFFIDLYVPAEPFPYHIKVDLELPPPFMLDALAAQLYRQLLAAPDSVKRETAIEECNSTLIDCDPTDNTIKAIVDSKVLS